MINLSYLQIMEKYNEYVSENKPDLTDDLKVAKLIRPMIMQHPKQEQLWGLFADSKLRLLETLQVNQGSLNSSTVDIAAIVRKAAEIGAHGVILIHNHPSGNACPSPEDLNITLAIGVALRMINVVLYDHLIIASSGNYDYISLHHLGHYNYAMAQNKFTQIMEMVK